MWISANYSKMLLFGHKQNSLTQIWFQMSADILYEPVLIKYAVPNYLVLVIETSKLRLNSTDFK